MEKPVFKMKEKVWIYLGAVKSRWYFVNVSKKASKEIKDGYHFMGKKGFGSVPVKVTVGMTIWKTSIFPDTKHGVYILPLKKDAREKEGIKQGKMLSYSIEIQI